MAQRETVTNADLRERLNGSDFFWGISAAVGWGCTNNPFDVMLVQYLLLRAYDTTIFPTKNAISCDGVFGRQTHTWIKDFQSHLWWMWADGKVDAAGGNKRESTKSKTPYTIHELNYFLKDIDPFIYNDITVDADLPAVLRSELSKIVVSGDVIAV